MAKAVLLVVLSALSLYTPGVARAMDAEAGQTTRQRPAPANAATLPAEAQVPAANSGSAPVATPTASMLLDITLERRHNGKVEAMAAGHVFAVGDIIRLKLTSHYDGYLYVMDQGTSGKFATVFPARETGGDNRIRMTKQYLVPAVEDGWFQVDGPAGFDVLYFLLSPTALAAPTASSFAAPGPVSSLRPRCNDEIFKARGDCTDDSAGPAAVAPGQPLPAPIAPLADGASRDITFTNKSNGTVGVSGETSAPMLYTFRLAHL